MNIRLTFLRYQSRRVLVLEALGLAVLIAAVEYISGPEISTSFFFLLPISIATWYVSRGAGLALAALSAAAWLVVEEVSGHVYSGAGVAVWNTLVRVGFFVLFAVLLAELRDALQRERTAARTDALTGVCNGRAFHELAELEHGRSQRYLHSYTLAFIDIDDFKHINDDYGHARGDLVLRTVGQALLRQLRGEDIVARLGGDEFVALLPETGGGGARSAVEKIKRALESDLKPLGIPVTVSVGAVTVQPETMDLEQGMRLADELMYSVKTAGKAGVRFAVANGGVAREA